MFSTAGSNHRGFVVACVLLFACLAVVIMPEFAKALNIHEYRDTLSDSGPSEQSNHTIEFVLNTSIGPGSAIEVTPPPGFTVLATSTFAERNVELFVNGNPRVSSSSAAAGIDRIEITPGSPGFFRYTLAPDFSIAAGSRLRLKIGNHTSYALSPVTTFSTSTGTTTSPGDIEPIVNSSVLGRHDVQIEVYDGSLVADAKPIIFMVEKVRVPNADTRETVPPVRFNGAPTSTVGGTTLSVEISLETNELAICKYDTVAGTDFNAMPNTFGNTGLIFHSQVVPIVPNSVNTFYIRCIDDEDNFNIDDYLIQFAVSDIPTGTANEDGDIAGDGTGSGNDGTGTGAGGGGTSGQADGQEPLEGGSSGSGGSGGGGGGGSGGRTGSEAGGGFENEDAPYRSGDGRVVISGFGYPGARITILVDGQIADGTTANAQGEYEITLDAIARGVYTFGVYGTDRNGVKSSTFSTSFTVTGARTSALSNINILPSIFVDPDPVDIGQQLTISGYTLPNASVTIENGRTGARGSTLNATSDGSGFWSVPVNTAGFTLGTYQVRARAAQTGTLRSTNFSGYSFYGVGQEADLPISADLNRDGRVNLIDFSILLFWWNTDGGDSNPPADINRDGTVSLTDFSILLFNWTG